MADCEAAKWYLKTILAQPDAIIRVATLKERETLDAAIRDQEAGAEAAFKRALKPNLPAKAISIARTAHPEFPQLSVENAGKLLRAKWSEYLNAASAFMSTDKVVISGVEEEYGMAREKFFLTTQAALDQAVTTAQAAHEIAVQRMEKEITACLAELEERWDDVHFEAALHVWGKSPDSKDDRNHGLGHHAGVVHYFEYRTAQEKWRFDKGPTPLSIEGFIQLSLRIDQYLQNARHQDISHAQRWADDLGQIRLNLRTNEGMFISAFQAVGDDRVRAITFILEVDGKSPCSGQFGNLSTRLPILGSTSWERAGGKFRCSNAHHTTLCSTG